MGVGAAIVGAAVVGGVMANKAAGKAADAQGQAAATAAGVQREELAFAKEKYGETQEMMQPWEQGGLSAFQMQQDYTGVNGVEAQKNAYANYAESPGVAWAREQGMQGVASNLAVSGIGGGTRLKAMSDYNQGLAMQDFSNQFNRLGSVTNVGLNAANTLAGSAAGVSSAAINSSAGQANSINTAGAARAAGITGRAQAFSSGISNVANIYAANKMGLYG